MEWTRIRNAAWITAIVILAGCGAARNVLQPGGSDSPPGGHLVAAYHPWWTQDGWRAYDPSTYDEVYFFSVEIDATGAIADRNGWPDSWYVMQRSLTDASVRVTPVVTLFDHGAFRRLFASTASWEHLMTTLLNLLRDSPAAGGLQIDFEIRQPVPAGVRDEFSRFLRTLRTAMDQLRPDLRLSVFLLAYDTNDVFDEAAIASAADYVIVQGYDLHARGDARTGPLAALMGWGFRNWTSVVERLEGLGVPREKIVMGVPYFGYEWPAASNAPGARTLGTGTTIRFAPPGVDGASDRLPSAVERAEAYGARRDPASGSPYYAYRDGSRWRQGWFEDAESLAEKYRFVRRTGLRGVAVFPAAYGNDELADLLRQAFD